MTRAIQIGDLVQLDKAGPTGVVTTIDTSNPNARWHRAWVRWPDRSRRSDALVDRLTRIDSGCARPREVCLAEEEKEQAMDARSYRPSNGTEGMLFTDRFCDRCTKDDGEELLCPILTATLIHAPGEEDYPPEWIEGDAGPRCTAFEERTTP